MPTAVRKSFEVCDDIVSSGSFSRKHLEHMVGQKTYNRFSQGKSDELVSNCSSPKNVADV